MNIQESTGRSMAAHPAIKDTRDLYGTPAGTKCGTDYAALNRALAGQEIAFVHSVLPGVTVQLQKNMPCLLCGQGKDCANFRIDKGRLWYFCRKCPKQRCDVFTFLQQYLRLSESDVRAIAARYCGFSNEPYVIASAALRIVNRSQVSAKTPPAIDASAQQKIEKLWNGSRAIVPGDPVDLYLANRGFSGAHPADIRLHERCDYWEEVSPGSWKITGQYPAMLAAIRNPSGALVNVHRTFLTPDGHKARGADSKKLKNAPYDGAARGCAIQLYPATDRLGVCEGIETGLACYQQTLIPCWAAISASLMKGVLIPDTVTDVWIFADHDESNAGAEAALVLQKRLIGLGKRVRILMPTESGTDWADTLARKEQV